MSKYVDDNYDIQLALLDNLVYILPVGTSDIEGQSVQDIADFLSKTGYPLACFMTKDEWESVLTAIKNDDYFKEMYISDYYKGDLGGKGVLFKDADGGKIVSFTGTGDNEWVPNAYGLLSDHASEIQEEAANWIQKLIDKKLLATSDDIAVSGHSTGGNKSEYVTVNFPDYFNYCLSYDGQGHSSWFMTEYKTEIEQAIAEGKFKRIAAGGNTGDYVNSFGIPLVSTIYYECLTVSNPAKWHAPIATLEIDKAGNVKFSEKVEQSALVRMLNTFTVRLAEVDDGLDIGRSVMWMIQSSFGGDASVMTQEEANVNLVKAAAIMGDLINNSPQFKADMIELLQDKNLHQVVTTMLSDMLGPDSPYLPLIEATLQNPALAPFLVDTLGTVLPHANTLAEAFGMASPDAANGSDSAMDKLKAVSEVLSALSNVVNYANSNADIKEAITQLARDGIFGDFVQGIAGNPLGATIAWGIIGIVKDIAGTVAFFGNLAADAWGLIEQIGQFLGDVFTEVGHELLKTVDQIGIWTADFLSGLDDLINQGVEIVRESAAEFFAMVNNAIDGAVSLLLNMADGVANFVDGAVSAIGDGVLAVADGITAVAQNVFHELNSMVENTVSVVISAFNDARDTVSEMAGDIWRDLTTAVSEVLSGRKTTWRDALDNMIEKLVAFVKGFEANIPSLIKASIREVKNMFLDFAVNVKSLSKNSNIALKHRGGFVDVGSSTSISTAYNVVNNGKIAVNLSELRKLKGFAEDLLREIESRVKITTKARSMANDSIRQYTQSYVQSDGNAVVNACSKLETDTSRARDELNNIIRGVTSTIDGYIKLEREFN